MKILWLSWKDHEHPLAGGAEVVLRELNKRLVADGHEVTVLTKHHERVDKIDKNDGVTYLRVGTNRYVHSFQALKYYLQNLRGKYDMVIEVVNTAPYLAAMFGGKQPIYLFYHQLAHEIWTYETGFPLNSIGRYILEPTANRLLSRSSAKGVITVSQSSKDDLEGHGFDPAKIHIISEGIELEPVKSLDGIKKYKVPTVLSLGALRAMKQTLHQIEAFERAKERMPKLRMKIAGAPDSTYGDKVLQRIKASKHAADIEYLGRVSKSDKIKLMQKSHLITVTSVKEGWGLIVTEANSQGTPAVAYDADGLRDSVRDEDTGYLATFGDPENLADKIVHALSDKERYERIRENAWRWSRDITFDQAYKDFRKVTSV